MIEVMELLIQKFGGTSVKTKENREHVIKQIKDELDKGYKLVVVVSALGRSPDPYATDTLMSMFDYPEHSDDSKREIDMVMYCGETIASVVLYKELQHSSLLATSINGAKERLITVENYNEAKINKVKTCRIKHEIKTHDVVVVTG